MIIHNSTKAVRRFETGVVVEAEDGLIASPMEIKDSPTASGNRLIVVPSGEKMINPSLQLNPDARYTFHVTTAGYYSMYIRYASDSNSDSFYYHYNSDPYQEQDVGYSLGWDWITINAVHLSAGQHTFDIIHCTPRMYFDLLVLATEFTDEQKQDVEDAITICQPGSSAMAKNSNAVTFDTMGGAIAIQAESITLHPAYFSLETEETGEGSHVICSLKNIMKKPSPDEMGAEFNLNIDKSARYTVWVRYAASNTSKIYCYVDDDEGEDYLADYLVRTDSLNDYQWQKIYQGVTKLYQSSKHNFRILPAKADCRIDKIVVVSSSSYTPTDDDMLNDLAGPKACTLPSGVYPVPDVLPPDAHPRLLFTPSHISMIQENMTKPQNASALTSFQQHLASTADGRVGPQIAYGKSTYSASILADLEAWAFDYAINGNVTSGYKAVTGIKNYLDTVDFEPRNDFSRPMGHSIFVASEIYDWCYPLLTEHDKQFIIAECESIAGGMEVGWPPAKQGPVSDHSCEAQLLRDLTGFAIAVYNERPDIYNYVVGRLLNDYVPPRNFWHSSHMHHQGDAYGSYRYTWDLMFLWMMHRMTGQQVFIDDAQYLPYQWIYSRRPDGKMLRGGDSQNPRSEPDGYWGGYRIALLHTANFFKNPYLKHEALKGKSDLSFFSMEDGVFTPVQALILNDPDLCRQNYNHLPLTKYFCSPCGMMVARTGWDDAVVDCNSSVAIAEMKIGELWSTGHHHLDAGSFQLYYKGILALDSGIYYLFHSPHNKNYNQETIAHNSLIIYDPLEDTGSRVNSGGQRRPEAVDGILRNISHWLPNQKDFYAQENTYVTGKVLEHEYDTQNPVPQYSYIKGDISRAYTSKVLQDGGVIRSMLFMPLDDPDHPAVLIVMDKVVSSDAAFKKSWLLHTQQEPQISGKTAFVKRDIDDYNGRMDLTTLLPADATLVKVGGPGNEFYAGTQNWDPLIDVGEKGEAGKWRIEVSPSSQNTTDYFLNVMQVSDADKNAEPLYCPLIETDMVAGTMLSNRVAIFSKSADKLQEHFSFTIPVTDNNLEIFVAGVKEGCWKITRSEQSDIYRTASVDGGVLYFTGGSGTYTLYQDTL